MALEKWVMNCMNPNCKADYKAFTVEIETEHYTDALGNPEVRIRYPKKHFCPKCQNTGKGGDRYKY